MCSTLNSFLKALLSLSCVLCCFFSFDLYRQSKLNTHIWKKQSKAPRMRGNMLCLSFWTRVTLLDMILSSSIFFLADFIFDYRRIEFHHGYAPHFCYPSLSWWTIRLTTFLSYCEASFLPMEFLDKKKCVWFYFGKFQISELLYTVLVKTIFY